MTVRNIAYIILCIGLFGAALYSAEPMLYYIAYVLLFMPVIAFAILFTIVLRYKYMETIDARQVMRGETINYSLDVHNEDVFLYPYVKVVFYSDHFITRSLFPDQAFFITPGSKYSINKSISCMHIGCYQVGVRFFEFKDFFGFFKLCSNFYNENKEVRVLPRIHQLDKFRVLYTAFYDSYESGSKPGMEDYSEITEIKKYTQGLPLKNIHWKLSAKMGELIAKEFNEPQRKRVSIFMDVGNCGIDDRTFLLARDIILESTIAISYFCLRKFIPATIYCNDTNLAILPISNKNEFDTAYGKLFYMYFEQRLPFKQVIELTVKQHMAVKDLVLVTQNLNDDLYDCIITEKYSGRSITLIYPDLNNNLEKDYIKHFIDALRENGVAVYRINHADEIKTVLERN